MTNQSFESERHFDHLDDTGQFDAATIREMTGFETDGSDEDFTAEAIAARSGNIALAGYLRDPEIDQNQKGGLNHQAWAAANADPLQAQANAEGLLKARRALRNLPTKEV